MFQFQFQFPVQFLPLSPENDMAETPVPTRQTVSTARTGATVILPVVGPTVNRKDKTRPCTGRC